MQTSALPDWNDLRYVMALARGRSLAAASETLGVNLTTVFRRLNAIEDRLGVRLFDRRSGRYQPTPSGERMIGVAEQVEEQVTVLARSIAGGDLRLAGRLRVTSSETLAYRLLTRHLAAFRESNPGIQIDLVIDNRMLSLSRREADVALRASRPRQAGLYGRKLAQIAWTLYASPFYAKANGLPRSPADLRRHRVIGWDERAEPFRAVEWLSRAAPEEAVVYRSSSLVNQLIAAQAGIGIALLPCYLADPEADLVRAMPPIDEVKPELWMITHADLKHTARVRAFFDVVGEALIADRRLLEGRRAKA